MTFPVATIEALLLAADPEDFSSVSRHELVFDLDGIVGDRRHRGRTRLADVRLKAYRKGQDEVLNRQSVSLIDSESLDYIGDRLELDPAVIEAAYGQSRRLFLARCLGANILLGAFAGVDRIPSFYSLQSGTDFGPYDEPTGKFTAATLMITRYNAPCIHPGRKIEQLYPDAPEGLAQRFVAAAEGRRGFVAMVVKAGRMTVGESVTFCPLPSA